MIKDGFSFIELLIILVILFILVFISFFQFIKWREVYRVKNFSYDFGSYINLSRDLSRKNGVRIVVAVAKPGENLNSFFPTEKEKVIGVIFADNNKNGNFDSSSDDVIFLGADNKIEVVKTFGRNCLNNKAKCVIFFPVGPPLIGAVPKIMVFQSLLYPEVKYGVNFMGITGITKVVRLKE